MSEYLTYSRVRRTKRAGTILQHCHELTGRMSAWHEAGFLEFIKSKGGCVDSPVPAPEIFR